MQRVGASYQVSKLPSLTPGQVRAQVREGGGTMPSFDIDEVSDEELEHILAHLQQQGSLK